MAVSATLLDSGATAQDLASYNTNSVTPPANKPIYLFAYAADTNTDPYTVTGQGLTWVHVRTQQLSAQSDEGLQFFRAQGAAPSTGALTIDMGADAGTGLVWAEVYFDGADISGTNGSGSVVAHYGEGDSSTTTPTLNNPAMSAWGAGNAGIVAFGHNVEQDIVPEWTQLVDVGYSPPARRFCVAFTTTPDTTPSATVSSANLWSIIAVEVKAAAVAASTEDRRGLLRMRRTPMSIG